MTHSHLFGTDYNETDPQEVPYHNAVHHMCSYWVSQLHFVISELNILQTLSETADFSLFPTQFSD